ncbi:ABC transporter ATP-binding protein [Neorhizobium alkalisoli]|uniref:Peptide/nickel transport system ATP-binding protein n=1 Tax=Neorhizobium alkalisoli TaxID=528178 RepID=A0A561R7X3_9HYPH|nr:oligopeptide/dipeptide ABC transporter ATP-binding protein [Neorhizobium alkalisoli]TWF58713.1 peptide/nickel transport system ATP-binding protein [Neorhizobium alkalisoli]
MSAPLLVAQNIARSYEMNRGLWQKASTVQAVSDVTLSVDRNETLGIVGESGSGKSTTGRVLLGLEPPTAGTVSFDGRRLPFIGSAEWKTQRTRMQMIYQDPLGALDRRLTVSVQMREPLDIHRIGTPAEREARVSELLRAVGLSAEVGRRYPHELSGGQRQRVVLARALSTRPDLLVCDEPVSALDVSIQAQVVNLLSDLQAELGLAMVFISHDLRVVRQISHRIAVMYLGRIVEEGDADDLFARPVHPYTRALVSAAPIPGRKINGRIMLRGEPPNPAKRPSGCAFHPRCTDAIARCSVEMPSLVDLGGGRKAACHLAGAASQAMPPIARAAENSAPAPGLCEGIA